MPLSFGYLTQLLNATPMRMKNPPHSGLSVRHECLEPLGLSITKGAKVLSVTRQAMNNLVSGRAAISAELAIRLERALGGRAETWFRMQAAYDLGQAEKRLGRSKSSASKRHWYRPEHNVIRDHAVPTNHRVIDPAHVRHQDLILSAYSCRGARECGTTRQKGEAQSREPLSDALRTGQSRIQKFRNTAPCVEILAGHCRQPVCRC